MADVFISHHVDTTWELAARIADKLKSAGISCWYCERDEKAGFRYMEKIAEAIESSRIFLLILNQKATYSDIINKEIHLAQELIQEGKPIQLLQFRIENCKPTRAMRLIFAGIHYQDGIKPPMDERIKELTDQIQDIIIKDNTQGEIVTTQSPIVTQAPIITPPPAIVTPRHGIIAAGRSHTVGLRKDGSVVAVGDNRDGQCNVKDWKLW